MNLDCHYYGTYYIARAAGFSDSEAKKIAWAAQTVDVVDCSALKKIYNQNKSVPRVITLVENAVLASHMNLYTNAYRSLIMFAWVPFHFLPDYSDETNSVPSIDGNAVFLKDCGAEEQKAFKKYEHVYQEDYRLICKTSSKLCKRMIENVKENYKPNDEKILYRVGVCMHVLADTWSHQDFCGNGDSFINTGLYEDPYGCYESGLSWIFKMVPKKKAFSSAWVGHGSVNSNPDIPVKKYLYYPAYKSSSKSDSKSIVDNCDRFLKAFYQMFFALKYIKGNDNFNNIEDIDEKNYLMLDEEKSEFTIEELESTNVQCENSSVYKILKYIFQNTDDTECKKWKGMLSECSLQYKFDDCENDVVDFLNSALDHRNFVMSQLGYGDKIKVVDSFIEKILTTSDEDLKKEIDAFDKDDIYFDNEIESNKNDTSISTEKSKDVDDSKTNVDKPTQVTNPLLAEESLLNSSDEKKLSTLGSFFEGTQNAHASGISAGMFDQPVVIEPAKKTDKAD